MRTILFFLFSISLLSAQDYTKYVDPFIGTGGHGHTFPGPTTPFGMVQLSPDTDTQGWDWSSGYHITDNSMIGFSHTHLSGTGVGDYGDILLMPFTGEIKWKPGSKQNPDEGYRSRFSHDNEEASPGYYRVLLDDYKINVELTATSRAGFHKYSFPAGKQSAIMLDLAHGISDRVKEAQFTIVNDHEVMGLRRSNGWANDQYLYFYISFSKPFKSSVSMVDNKEGMVSEASGKIIKTAFVFDTEEGETVYAKVGISAVSTDGAKNNLFTEIPGWDFEKALTDARALWESWLSKIKVEGGSDDEKTVFYTALYHSLLTPNLYMDVDGKYRGRDLEIHQAKDMNYYTLFSLWDTFRAAHPLYTLIAPDFNRDFIKTMLIQYQQGGDLPIWELSANETGTMIGYHSVPVIVDAFMKGQDDFDTELAMEAMKHTSTRDYRGLSDYRKIGYIPSDKEVNSVSKCVEYTFDDWCIAQMAKQLGKDDDYKTYIKRSQNYVNHFDPETKFMRGRLASGMWRTPFDPRDVSHLGNSDFTEGNSWQYTFFVPHNVNHLIDLIGGLDAFDQKLDLLFNEGELFGLEHSPDVSGLIGNYAHGNEPSHHIGYLYSYAGKSFKTQEIINRIKNEMYKTGPQGLPGNEDCGQMSAWYVFSAMGFYPVAPGQNQYVIGTPTFDKVVFDNGKGTSFTITSDKSTTDGFYIKSFSLNGSDYSKNYIRHADLIKNGRLEFKLSKEPNKEWAQKETDRVHSDKIPEGLKIERVEKTHAMMPYFNDEENLFSGNKEITLATITSNSEIYYTLDGSDPGKKSNLYTGPFSIDKTCTVKASTFKEGFQPSFVFSRKFTKVNFSNFDKINLTLKNEPHGNYNNGGKYALIDRTYGSKVYGDGKWLGFQGDDLEATFDLGGSFDIADVKARFLKSQGSWIYLPRSVICLVSQDGTSFTEVARQELVPPKDFEDDEIKEITLNVNKDGVRYLKVIAENQSTNPEWHGSPGEKCWLFADEITISEK